MPNLVQYQIVPTTTDKELYQCKPLSTPSTLTDQAAYKRGIFHQIIATCGVLLLSASCGMPIGYSAVLLPQLTAPNATSEIAIDIEMGSWIASVHSLATPMGALVSAPLADYIGRRSTMLAACIPVFIGWIVLALSQSYTMVIAGRLLCVFATGLLAGPAQVYIAETAEPNLRSLLIGAPFVSYSMGILFVYALGSVFHWRTVAWCGNILPTLSAIALFCIPESPVWLVRQKQLTKALKGLTFLRGSEVNAQNEINDMHDRLRREHAMIISVARVQLVWVPISNFLPSLRSFKISGGAAAPILATPMAMMQTNENIFTLCSQRAALKPLVIVIMLSFLQMFSGTFIVVFYAIDIISEFGGDFDTKTAAIWTAVVRMICAIIFCVVLVFVRRRRILVVSGIGSGLSCLALSIYMYTRANQPKNDADIFVAATCLLCYIAFNTALMVMPGIMIGELFPAKIRGRTAGGVNTIMNISLFGLAKAFPMIQIAIKMRGVFLMFAVASFLASISMFLLQPETKGRSLDQIEDYFNEDHWFWFKRDKSYKFEKSEIKA